MSFSIAILARKTFCCLLWQLLMCISQRQAYGNIEQLSPKVFIVRMKDPPLVAQYHTIMAEAMGKSYYPSSGKLDFSASEYFTKYASELRNSHSNLLEEIFEPKTYEILYSYTHLLNGFAVKLADCLQIEAIAQHPKVASTEPEKLFQKLTTHTPDFLGLPSGAWKEFGGVHHAGENVVIGILDTGIYPHHLSFGNKPSQPYEPLLQWPIMNSSKCEMNLENFPEGLCNGKIVAARHFSKGIIAANVFNASYDYDSPLDGDGHGTHTASTAAGNNGVPLEVANYRYGWASGVAPRARIGVYKVIYRDGGFLSDVLAGLDQACEDGVDVLSISLGATSGAYGIPCLNSFDVALLLAVKAGIVVVHAAGNNGPFPMSMNSYGPWLISVAASFTDRVYLNPVILESGQEVDGAGLSVGTPGEAWYTLIHAQDAFLNGTSAYDFEYFSYCQDPSPFNASLISGKILICNFVDYFSGAISTQLNNAIATAKNNSAIGLIMLAQVSEDAPQEREISFDPIPFSFPTTFITNSNLSKVVSQYYNDAITRDTLRGGAITHFGARARLIDSRNASFSAEAPKVAAFSSRGPVYANTITSIIGDILKPDILAPGSGIWAAWSPIGIDVGGFTGEKFALLSGTSMAAPHIAGLAGLLRQKYPTWSVSAIHSAIQTTAFTLDNRLNLIEAQQPEANTSAPLGHASPFDVGSGAVNASGAFDPGLVFVADFQDYINFMCTLPGADENSIKDATSAPCLTKDDARASDLNTPSITIANLIGFRRVKRIVTNVGTHSKETYKASIEAPNGVDVSIHPSSFVIKKSHILSFVTTLKATRANQEFTFGSITWTSDKGHVVRLPLAISATSVTG